MICWSCEKHAGQGPLCGACGAVQPPDAGADHFQVLGVPPRFDLDAADLERRYKDLTKLLHPDRFAIADARARRASLARTVQLNQAWRALADPVRRAEVLLARSGIEVGGEEGTVRRTDGGGKQRLPVPQALLVQTMELREALSEARAAGDVARASRLADDVRRHRARAMTEVAAAFATAGPDLEAIAGHLVAVRYYDRFLEEAAA